MRVDSATFKQDTPPYLSIIGPSKNFPNAMAQVDNVRTWAMICCGVMSILDGRASPEFSDVINANTDGNAHFAPMIAK